MPTLKDYAVEQAYLIDEVADLIIWETVNSKDDITDKCMRCTEPNRLEDVVTDWYVSMTDNLFEQIAVRNLLGGVDWEPIFDWYVQYTSDVREEGYTTNTEYIEAVMREAEGKEELINEG